MGVAEITPGISGATIAGLFNVYKGFISFLNSVNPIKLNSGIKLFFKEIDINFIAPLLIGMSISIYLSAFAIDYLMSTYLFFFKNPTRCLNPLLIHKLIHIFHGKFSKFVTKVHAI